MKKIFHLSESNINLAKEEVLSLADSKTSELYEDVLVCDDNSGLDLEKRLGYSHSIFSFLFACSISQLKKKIDKFDWQSIYKRNFCVRVHGETDSFEKKIAFLIYKKIKSPRVNLENPHTKIEIFIRDNKAIAGLFLNEVDKSFNSRKAHFRPGFHPTSLHPGLARACINLTGLKKGKLLDPFCGAGGILIEAGLMGFDIIGYDIVDEQISMAKKNMDYYKIKKYRLEKKDSRNIRQKVDAIVTDLPYGKGSKGKNLAQLYTDFLIKSYGTTKTIVLIFPDFIDHKKILSQTKWKVEKKFQIYVHKSLTRILVRLKK
jgi:tRNA (guanine10-N2)-dimethyltransferase